MTSDRKTRANIELLLFSTATGWSKYRNSSLPLAIATPLPSSPRHHHDPGMKGLMHAYLELCFSSCV
jgi:hypothetical protein